SHALWQQRLGGARTIINRMIEVGGVSRQVVGVMPPEFHFPSRRTQVWVPLHNDARNTILYWADAFMPVVGRLHPDTPLQQARAEIKIFQSRVRGMFPWQMPAAWNADVSVVPLQTGLVADMQLPLLTFLAPLPLVLLFSSAN